MHARAHRSASIWHCVLSLVALCALGSIRSAQADVWEPYLQEWLGFAGSHMGSSIAVDGDMSGTTFIYVGAPYETVNGNAEAGGVYVWAPSGQGVVPVAEFFATTPQAGAHFGASIAARNGDIVVGSPYYNQAGGAGAGAGAVYFFHNDGSEPVFIASTGVFSGNGGNFGGAVALNGDFAVGSAVNLASGCAYTFRYVSQTGLWTPYPSDDVTCGSNGEKLGSSLAILATGTDAFLMVAGAPAATQGANALAGAVHVYIPHNDALLEISTLAAQSPAFLDAFGTSVGIDANFLYVGGTGRDNGAGRTGSVTIFQPGFIIGYNNIGEYFPSPPTTIGGHCGASLNVDPVAPGGFVLGCPDSETAYFAGEGTARVYRPFVFLGTPVWNESLLTFGSQAHGADALGTSVDIHGNRAFAGAPKAHLGSQTGNGAFKEFVPDKLFQAGFD